MTLRAWLAFVRRYRELRSRSKLEAQLEGWYRTQRVPPRRSTCVCGHVVVFMDLTMEAADPRLVECPQCLARRVFMFRRGELVATGPWMGTAEATLRRLSAQYVPAIARESFGVELGSTIGREYAAWRAARPWLRRLPRWLRAACWYRHEHSPRLRALWAARRTT